ncbi:WD repeat domain phosphoinositide-interacting protein 3 [Tritrichomonas musculus]|uniref:WD repeat domain phosphoinositide-interacting protein 3 n=1 Tax=Tritrichomonas musculus TaxID=1915356 RepID=A0ABR2K7N0_9EUKA
MIGSLSLSNDNSSIAVSIDHGFFVYSTDPLVRKFQKEFQLYNITKVTTSNDGNFIAFVGISTEESTENQPQQSTSITSTVTNAITSVLSSALSSNNHNANENGNAKATVFVWNNFYGECHCRFDLDKKKGENRVLAMKLIGQLLLIVFESKTCVFDIETKMMKLQHNTEMNTNGAADVIISPEDGETQLVAVCSAEVGKIDVYQLVSGENPSRFSIYAAKHPVTLIKFSPDSTLIATASEKGTLIRVFDSTTGSALSTFRRGALMPASILDVCFSPSNTELVAISSNGTVHLFQSDIRNTNQNEYPRSVAKLAIDKAAFVQSAFRNQDEFYILASTGHFYTISVSEQNALVLKSKQSVLEV